LAKAAVPRRWATLEPQPGASTRRADARPAVVRAEQRREPPRLGDGVVVDEREQLAARGCDARVAGARNAGLGFLDASQAWSTFGPAGDALGCAVGGAVVDDEDLELLGGQRLARERGEAGVE